MVADIFCRRTVFVIGGIQPARIIKILGRLKIPSPSGKYAPLQIIPLGISLPRGNRIELDIRLIIILLGDIAANPGKAAPIFSSAVLGVSCARSPRAVSLSRRAYFSAAASASAHVDESGDTGPEAIISTGSPTISLNITANTCAGAQ